MQAHRVSHTFLFPTALKAMMKAVPQPRTRYRLALQRARKWMWELGVPVASERRDAIAIKRADDVGPGRAVGRGQADVKLMTGIGIRCGAVESGALSACRGIRPFPAGITRQCAVDSLNCEGASVGILENHAAHNWCGVIGWPNLSSQ